MKVCANLNNKTSVDVVEKQILPENLDEGRASEENDVSSNETSECEDRLERGLFLVLSFIIGLCIFGTMISIAGVLYLKFHQSRGHLTARENRNIVEISSIRAPAAMSLKFDQEIDPENETLIARESSLASPMNPSTLSPSSLSPSTLSDLLDVITSPSSREAIEVTSPASEANMKTKATTTKVKTITTTELTGGEKDTKPMTSTSSPAFVTVKSQWTLERPPTAKQLFQTVKQFFQFFRTGRYDIDRY